MCNYTIAFSRPSYFGAGGEVFDSFIALIRYLLVDFICEDEDDNRGSGR